MIERMHLQNFKACRDVPARIGRLTVLAGLNSSGKSSFLQAIAALRQSYGEAGRAQALMLRGEIVQLGHGRDVLSEGAEGPEDAIILDFVENGQSCRWVCPSVPTDSELPFKAAPDAVPEFVHAATFQFLQADRVTPAPLYPQAPRETKAIGFLGPRGEYTADYLARYVDAPVRDKRCFASGAPGSDSSMLQMVAPTTKLTDQVAAWLQHLSPGVRLGASRVEGTDEVLLQFNYAGISRTPRTNDYRPTNVGFGLTYSLPIVVACLAAPPGALLLLENPEAHLHPQGQLALGQLLAATAADDVQILVETHSDHLLNGLRLAVKRSAIGHEQVVMHFFTRHTETGETSIETPAMLADGKLSNWPDGFFDQWEKSLDALMG
jgi:predicted ATPase